MSHQVELILLIANTVYNIYDNDIRNITNSIVIYVSSLPQEIWKEGLFVIEYYFHRNLYDTSNFF